MRVFPCGSVPLLTAQLPYNPRYAEPNNEESCIAFCAAYKVLQPRAEVGKRTQNPDSSKIGRIIHQCRV